jgi:hypothetical protein
MIERIGLSPRVAPSLMVTSYLETLILRNGGKMPPKKRGCVASVSQRIAATHQKCPENNENKWQHDATWSGAQFTAAYCFR